jgi:hypothetical protein
MIVGIGCDKLLVNVDNDRVTMELVGLVTMIGCLYMAFIFQGGRTGQG